MTLKQLETLWQWTVDLYAFDRKRSCDLDLCTHDLQNPVSSWPKCRKYLC